MMADEPTSKQDKSLESVLQAYGGLAEPPIVVWQEIRPQQTHITVRATRRYGTLSEIDPSYTPTWRSIENLSAEVPPVPFHQVAYHADEWAASFRLIQGISYDEATNIITVRYANAVYLFDVWQRQHDAAQAASGESEG